LIFAALKSLSDFQFEAMVDHFIANQRTAPMLKDFADDIEDSKRRDNQAGKGDVLQMLRDAEKNNKRADPEFVRACMRTIEAKLSGKMPKDQFWNEAVPLLYEAAGISHELKGNLNHE